MFEADFRPLPWQDLSSLTYSGGRIAGRRSLTWPMLSAALTELSSDDTVTLDLSAPFPRLCIDLEYLGKSPPVISGLAAPGAYAPISLIPAGVDVSLCGRGLQYFRHFVVQFSADEVIRHSDDHADTRRLTHGRASFNDPRLMRVVELLASECATDHPPSRLYADSLSVALFSALLRPDDAHEARGGLAPWQLRRVVEYLREHTVKEVPLDDLAGMVQLSRSYFCRAFRVSTGVTPHQWQLNARVELAKSLMLTTRQPLALVALEAGFSDQAHFTRMFRKITGNNPLQWIKSRRH